MLTLGESQAYDWCERSSEASQSNNTDECDPSTMMNLGECTYHLPIGAAIMRCRLFALPSAPPLISDGPRL